MRGRHVQRSVRGGGLVSGGARGIVSSPDLSQAIDIAQTDIAKRDASER